MTIDEYRTQHNKYICALYASLSAILLTYILLIALIVEYCKNYFAGLYGVIISYVGNRDLGHIIFLLLMCTPLTIIMIIIAVLYPSKYLSKRYKLYCPYCGSSLVDKNVSLKTGVCMCCNKSVATEQSASADDRRIRA